MSEILKYQNLQKGITVQEFIEYLDQQKVFTSQKATNQRRVYEIANVMQSLQIIEKVKDESNKPRLVWKGLKYLMSFKD